MTTSDHVLPMYPALSPTALHPVLLVGAGPGDPELLTLRAVRAIAEADVILVDALVNPVILVHARPDARITHVGKRGGCRSTPQAFIERLMVRAARAGARVVRLKGGDPLVFGRAGEEIDALRAADVGFEIVNGVTSALAAGAALGLSLTHRDHSPGIAFVTGHPQAGAGFAPEVVQAWRSMLDAGMTLAIYMGLTRLPEWRAALLAAGIDPTLPAACVRGAGRAGARCERTTLGELVERHAAADLPTRGTSTAGREPAMLLLGRILNAAVVARAVEQQARPAILAA